MKILEINKFNYLKGGAEKHFLDLARLLKSKGHEVAIFSMDNPKNEFSPWKKYFVSYVGYTAKDSWRSKLKGVGRMFYSLEAKRKIAKLLEDFRPDIVHIHNIYHQISPSILPAIKKRGLPIVMTVHDYKLICPNYLLRCGNENSAEFGRKKFSEFVKKKCFKNSYLKSFLVALEFALHKRLKIYENNIDLYIAPSVFVKNKLVDGGIDSGKIIVLSHFASQNSFDEKGRVNVKEKYVLHYGRLSEEKGVGELLEIFKSLPDSNLYLAGELENGFQIESAENVKFLGFLKPREIERYIKNSLFVVSASKLPETFGLVALEALQNGKPFLGYDAGALNEIVENDRSGYLCRNAEELKEKIKKLAGDEGLRILLSRNALERAEKFGREEYYEVFLKTLKSLAEKN